MATKKLFVGGLAWATDDGGLEQAFSRFGSVREAKVIMDRESGRSRGFGFVTFDNEAEAQEAQQNMDGADLDGRSIRVNEANERPRGGGGGDRRGGGGYRREDSGHDGGDGGTETVKRRGGGGRKW
jgi:RNA recognition motif-containing protein